MKEVMKRSHLLFISIITLGTILLFSTVSYAGSAEAEIPYVASSARYASHKGIVTLSWSKAYARTTTGAVTDVTGYEIQCSRKSNFSGAKTIKKSNKVRKMSITLKALKTKKKYKRNIKKYHFRVRSYYNTGDTTVYSRWCTASGAVSMIIYSPMTLKTLTASKNTATSGWGRVKSAKGYIIFNKKPNGTAWKKRGMVRKNSKVTYKDKNLAYSTQYMYSVISYKMKKTRSPGKYSSSYLKALEANGSGKSVTTGKFKMSAPIVRAQILNSALKVTWSQVAYAKNYDIQYSETEDFQQPQTLTVNSKELEEGLNSYTREINGINEDTNYYVRVRASGTYNKVDCQSGYSAAVLAKSGDGIYTIEFDGNGATSGKMGAVTVNTGEELILPANKFKRTGYKFDGWCYKENNILLLDSVLPMEFGIPDFINKDTIQDLAGPDQTIRLYACWQASGPQAAADWAVTISSDDDFYYGKKVVNHCWFCQGGAKTYICNALVASAYTHGMRYFNKYRSGSTEYKWWLKNGFSKVGKNAKMSEIKKGDVICCWNGKRWGHIMIAVTDGTAANPKIAHAAGKGLGASSIRQEDMKPRLKRYKKYYVVRLKSWKPYTATYSLGK